VLPPSGTGSRTRTSRRSPSRALLIAGELEDEDDEAAKVAAMIPTGQSLRLPGLGHRGACAASALTVPTARAFLDRWFARSERIRPSGWMQSTARVNP
jgi:hypothetical protein